MGLNPRRKASLGRYQLFKNKTLDKKKILDIDNVTEEFEIIKNDLSLLNDRFLALAMDYKHHIDSSFKEDKIYQLRNNILYRLLSAKFHIELLLGHISNVEKQIEQGTKSSNSTPIILYTDLFRQQITSLFDSFIYHTVSVFDYLSTITNYISNKKGNTLMWTQLAKSVRDKANRLSETRFSNTVDQIDREFVCKLYDYRAELIHRKADIGGYKVVHSFGYNEKVVSTFFAGKSLMQYFPTLKKLNSENDITIRYIAFWILREAITKITDILFALKEEMEFKSHGKEPFMFYLHPVTNEKLPVSISYWHENTYKKKEK